MSRDTILRDDDGNRWSMDNISNHSYMLGHVAGAERVAVWLEAIAVEMFRDRDDKGAVAMREIADQVRAKIVPELREAAAKHKADYPAKLSAEET